MCLVSVRLRESVRQSICDTLHACVTGSRTYFDTATSSPPSILSVPAAHVKLSPPLSSGKYLTQRPPKPPYRALEPPVPPAQTITYESLCLRGDLLTAYTHIPT